jgi:hypothetical protein
MVITLEPVTVHTGGVSEVNDTGSPEDEDADKVTGSPAFGWHGLEGDCLRLMPGRVHWAPGQVYRNDRVTAPAAAYWRCRPGRR